MPGRCQAIHELVLTLEAVSDEINTDIGKSLARAITVNARPLSVAEWSQLLSAHGRQVDAVAIAPMRLLGPAKRKRVLLMRNTFRQHRKQLTAVAIIALKPPGRYFDCNGACGVNRDEPYPQPVRNETMICPP